MEIGLVGLGKMGFNLAKNLRDHKHRVIGYDLNHAARQKMYEEQMECAETIEDLVDKLPARKVLWLMLPCGNATEKTIQRLNEVLFEGDIIIDAGNSHYKDSMRRGEYLRKKGIAYLDVGTSGGMDGARNGACFMIGGDVKAYNYLEDVFESIAVKNGGCMYAGKCGSGHFMKMIHNGIEYGMMQAIGEGFQLLKESAFVYDLEKVAKNWNHGSVIRGWLMELAESKFQDNPDLENLRGIVEASGEAKWTVETALELETPAPIIALSLMMRNRSKEEDSFSAKVVAALRNGFGGHECVSIEET